MVNTDNGMDADNRKQCSYFKHVAEYGNTSARDGRYVSCVGIRIRSRIRNANPIYEPVSDPRVPMRMPIIRALDQTRTAS